MIQFGSNGEGSASLQQKISPASSDTESEEQTVEIPSVSAIQAESTCSALVMNDVDHVVGAMEAESFDDAAIQPDSMAHLIQPSVKKGVILKFQGIEVESNHLPVLQKVWMEHGDVIEGSSIRSSDSITMALASLAKMVLILQTNSANTLTYDEACYLGSTSADLQYKHMKLDWLAPTVEKALVLHKAKQLQASLVELEKGKARVEEIERKLRSAMAAIKQDLDKDIRLVSERMPGQIDLEKCLW